MSEAVEPVKANAPKASDKKSIFARIALFWRQVLTELKKVVSPSRQEMLKLTGVVLVFVIIVMIFIGVVDYLIGLGVFHILGG